MRAKAGSMLVYLLCVCLPFVLAEHVARQITIEEQFTLLSNLDQGAITRTKEAFAGAKAAHQALSQLDAAPCSDAHIIAMRRVQGNNRFVSGIAYYTDPAFIECTTLSRVDPGFKRAQFEYMTEDGFGVVTRTTPGESRLKPMIVLGRAPYDMLIDPDDLVDIAVDRHTQLAVLPRQGKVLASLGAPDDNLLREIAAQPGSIVRDGQIATVTSEGEWTAVAIRPERAMAPALRHLRRFLLPAAVMVAAALSVLWWLFLRWRYSFAGQLAGALRRGEFRVVYQPVVTLTDGRCIGAEALLRWQPKGAPEVPPTIFIPLAEETGHIFALTDHVIDSVARDMGAVLRANTALRISINICAADITTGRVLDVLDRRLKQADIAPRQILLEVTEQGVLDVERARGVLQRAREQGHPLAIDDFGTGFSSLQYLDSLPFDVLKLDQAFVTSIGQMTSRSPVLPHIIEMAHSLNMVCVAESVQTEEQRDYLRDKGVRLGQGWLFSKALTANDFLAYLARTH